MGSKDPGFQLTMTQTQTYRQRLLAPISRTQGSRDPRIQGSRYNHLSQILLGVQASKDYRIQGSRDPAENYAETNSETEPFGPNIENLRIKISKGPVNRH